MGIIAIPELFVTPLWKTIGQGVRAKYWQNNCENELEFE
jgi:hypothetical protein